MRRVLLLFAMAASFAFGQEAQRDTRADQREFTQLLDQIRDAIRAQDWPEAARLTSRLNSSVAMMRSRTTASPLIELQHLEILAGQNATTRNPLLPRLAKAAFAAGDWARAEGLANEALDAAQRGVFWWTGDAIHQGNIVLGRLALRQNKVDLAKKYLIAAGKTPGSSMLSSQGPAMQLAKDLLERGESATV